MADKDINALIRAYRNYITAADPNIQDSVYWGSDKFEDILDHLRERLGFIDSYGLLKFVNVELDNVDELFERAEAKQARVKDDEIADVLGENQTFVKSAPVPVAEPTKKQVKLTEALEDYKNEFGTTNNVKTLEQTSGHIKILIDAVGDVEVLNFNEEMLRKYRTVLDKRTRSSGGNIAAISSVTKNEHIESCKQVFKHALTFCDQSHINLFAHPNVKFKVGKKDKNKRVPFNKDELVRVFSHPIFTNTNGVYKHPYQYWGPLLALYTGSRANELAQLRVDDIVEVDGVWCISHSEDTPDKRLKTRDDRLVPLHPKLIELGFLDFVNLFKHKNYRWTDEKDNHRLFKGLNEDKVRGGYAKELSRWFNGGYRKETNKHFGFKHEIGIMAAAGERKDFHSFRHTFATAAQNAGIPDNFSYKITGHSDGKQLLGGAGAVYRQNVDEDVLYREICKLDYGEALEKVKPFIELNGEKKCRTKAEGRSKN